MNLTEAQEKTRVLFLQHNGLLLEGKNENQQARKLCEMFDEEGVALSSSCAKRIIRDARKEGLMVPNPKGIRTLHENERHELDKKHKKDRRVASGNATPAYVNDARGAVAA